MPWLLATAETAGTGEPALRPCTPRRKFVSDQHQPPELTVEEGVASSATTAGGEAFTQAQLTGCQADRSSETWEESWELAMQQQSKEACQQEGASGRGSVNAWGWWVVPQPQFRLNEVEQRWWDPVGETVATVSQPVQRREAIYE